MAIFSIKSLGIYAVTNVPNPFMSIAILCCPEAHATLPITPVKSPFMTRTNSPLL